MGNAQGGGEAEGGDGQPKALTRHSSKLATGKVILRSSISPTSPSSKKNVWNRDKLRELVKSGVLRIGHVKLKPKDVMALMLAAGSLGVTNIHLSDLRKTTTDGCHLGLAGALALRDALVYLPGLTSLDVSWNHLGPDGASALSTGLSHVSYLTQLSVYNNHIGKLGLAALCAGLTFVPRLRSLDIGHNAIGAEGVEILATTFRHISNLTELGLVGNDLGPEGALRLREHLLDVPQLKSLNLRWNGIQAAGATSLRDGLALAPSLETLLVDHNDIPYDLEVSLLMSVNARKNSAVYGQSLDSFFWASSDQDDRIVDASAYAPSTTDGSDSASVTSLDLGSADLSGLLRVSSFASELEHVKDATMGNTDGSSTDTPVIVGPPTTTTTVSAHFEDDDSDFDLEITLEGSTLAAGVVPTLDLLSKTSPSPTESQIE